MFDEPFIQQIRSFSKEIELTGRLPHKVLELIYEKGLFKLFVPKELNGQMLSFPEAIKAFEQSAWVDGSFGWLVQIGSGAGFFATTMEATIAKEVFSKREVYIAGSDFPSGTAQKVEGGYIVNGEWKYCSGSMNATIFTANCHIKADDQSDGTMKAFVFTPDQVDIIQDWNAFGLKGTNSHTIQVKEAFIPHEKTFDVFKPHYYYDHPVYHYPFLPFATANMAATSIGIARHFFDAAKEHINSKKTFWDKQDPYRFSKVMGDIASLEQDFKKDIHHFHSLIDDSWDLHVKGKSSTEKDFDDLISQSKRVVQSGVYGAQVIYRFLGMEAIMESGELNRIYRDLHTASQHKLLLP